MQPKIYTFPDHKIPLEKIDQHAYYVVEKLKTNGHRAYIVGGSVRDLLLNNRPKDFDISTSAEPKDIKRIFSHCLLIGKRFRLAHVRFGKKVIEVSTFRAGDVEDTSLILRDNIYGEEEEDVLRRDFTINGLYYDPETQTIIDYVNGFSDAKKMLLRTIGKPEIRFKQDPVRMIRLLKFRARFGFEIVGHTHEALIDCKKEIVKSSPARVFEELLRMLESGASKEFFQLLSEYTLLDILLPKIALFPNKEKIYSFLDWADVVMKKNHPHTLDRAVLLSSLIFPLLEEKIEKEYKKSKKSPHLGLIAEDAKQLIHEIFLPFFHLSRKIKGSMISLLTNQYRFTPVDREPRRIRLPNDPLFSLAMEFFKLRCLRHPELLKIYTSWNEALICSHKKGKQGLRKRRYRKSFSKKIPSSAMRIKEE